MVVEEAERWEQWVEVGGLVCLHYWLVERSVPVRQTDRAGGGPVSANWHHLSDLLLFLPVLFCFSQAAFRPYLPGPSRVGPGQAGKTERPRDHKCN